MLAVTGNRFDFIFSNIGTGAVPGTAVTPGVNNAEGSYAQIASGANISQDIYLFTIWVTDGGVNGNDKTHLIDIGVDPAGGTAYTAIASNIVCGLSGLGVVGGGILLVLPYFIKAGSSVAARVQGYHSSAGTVRVVGTFFGQPSRPEFVKIGQYTETIGTINASSQGISLTPGTSGVEGSWVSLGTTASACFSVQLGVQCSNSALNGLTYNFDLAAGDSNNKQMLIQDLRVSTTAQEEIRWNRQAFPNLYTELPANTELWVRGTCSGTPDAGWNAVALVIGG